MIHENGENLIFILSLPRSGSTLLSAILGNHPQVVCPPEPWLLLRLAELYGEGHDGPVFDDHIAGVAIRNFLSPELFMQAARSFALAAYNAKLAEGNAVHMIDKTPRYYHILPFIDHMFPRARKIWLKRHPLDVAASYKATWGRDIDHLLGEKTDSVTWDFPVGLPNLMEYFSQPDPLKYEIRYEDLVNDPQGEIGRLAEFCGLAMTTDLLSLHPHSRGVQALQGAPVGDPNLTRHSNVHHQSLGRCWEVLTPAESRRLTDFLGPETFRRLGYPAEDPQHAEYFQFTLTPEERQAALRHVRQRLETSKISRLAALYEKDGAIEYLRNEVNRLQTQLNGVRREHEKTSIQLNRTMEDLERSESLKLFLQQALQKHLSTTPDPAKDEAGEEQKAKIDALLEEEKHLENLLNNLHQRQQEVVDDQRTLCTTLTADRQNLGEQLGALQKIQEQQLRISQQMLQELEQSWQSTESARLALQQRLEELIQRLQGKETELAQVTAEYEKKLTLAEYDRLQQEAVHSELRSRLAEQSERIIPRIEREKQDLVEEKKRLEDNKNQLEENMKQLEEEKETLAEEKKHLQGENKRLQGEKEGLEQVKYALEGEREALKRAYESLEVREKWLTHSHAELTRENAHLTHENSAIRQGAAFRLGRILLAPARGIQQIFQRRGSK